MEFFLFCEVKNKKRSEVGEGCLCIFVWIEDEREEEEERREGESKGARELAVLSRKKKKNS